MKGKSAYGVKAKTPDDIEESASRDRLPLNGAKQLPGRCQAGRAFPNQPSVVRAEPANVPAVILVELTGIASPVCSRFDVSTGEAVGRQRAIRVVKAWCCHASKGKAS